MAIGVLIYHEDDYLSEQLRILLSGEQRLFSVYHFTDPAVGVQYYVAHPDRIKCVLSSPEYIAANGFGRNPAVVSIATDDVSQLEALSDEGFSINVYQRRDSIVNDLFTILRSANLIAHHQQETSDVFTLAFFSTQGGCGCTTLAYMAAAYATKSTPTAYICLDAGPCTETLYRTQPQIRAEEFLYSIQERADEKAILSALTRNEHGVYVFPTFSSLLDQAMLTVEDVEYLTKILTESGMVQTIIYDLNDMLGPIERSVLINSYRVAMVYTDDKMGTAKRKQLENDPNYTTYPFVQKELWVGNRCKANYNDGRFDVCFPVINNVDAIGDLQVLAANSASLSNGFNQILSHS